MIRVTCFLKNKKSRKKVHFRIADCNSVGEILLMHATLSFYLVKITTYSYRNGRIHFFHAPWVIHGTSPGFGISVVAPPIQVD